MNDFELYKGLSIPPKDALKTIDFGALKGKSDINPQWRYEALTNTFGLCGIGWKYEIDKTETIEVPSTGELMVYLTVKLYIKKDDKWSDAIPAIGGDFVLKKDKNGIHGNDEAYKMALTDALGKAMSMIGVAAEVYRGFEVSDTKYQARENYNNKEQSGNTKPLLLKIAELGKTKSLSNNDLTEIVKLKFKKSSSSLTIMECSDLLNNFDKYLDEFIASQPKE